MKILILFIIFSCKACGPGDYSAWGIWWDINSISTIRVYVSTQFPDAIRTRIITDVINQWNSHTQQDCGFSVQFTDDSASSNIIIRIDPDLYDDTYGLTPGDTRFGYDCVDHITGRIKHEEFDCRPAAWIRIAPIEILQRYNIDLYTVARHEMGHALGLTHVKNPDCLMYRKYTGPKDIGQGEDNGLICIYGSLFGDRVKPSAGSDYHIKVLDRRHVSIKIIQGACNGEGTGGADSAKIQMNFYHSGKTMTWDVIRTFNFASRYYEDSIVVELPPDDSNYTGWRVLKSYTYFPDTVIVTESDTFDFNALKVNEKRDTFVKNQLPDVKIYVQNNRLIIHNMLHEKIKATVYNAIGQPFLPPFFINPDEIRTIKIARGIYFVRIKYTDHRGRPKICIKPVEIF